jgi:arsenite methyltransferase
MSNTLDSEQAVRQRYSTAAGQREPELCCPVDYDAQYLKVIPQEVIDRDYGCGDPSKHVNEGETVLDLGSGGGKICFIAAQVVGPNGRVIGVDMNDEMLDLARRSKAQVGAQIGYENVEFCKGRIQDLTVDRDAVDAYLLENPVASEAGLQRLEAYISNLRINQTMIPDNSIDVVVSNCVLNLVDAAEKEQLFREIHRVLRPGGRAVISDIVSDEPVPDRLQQDAELWSGCISGAYQEDAFIQAFENVGFYGIEMPVLQQEPWQTVEGIEFRSATVIAYKGKEGPCNDHHEAVIYRGPFRQVTDDDGHTFIRGQRTAVCRKLFSLAARQPYVQHFIPVPPHQEVTLENAKDFDCDGAKIRSPKVTKGRGYNLTIVADSCCEADDCC